MEDGDQPVSVNCQEGNMITFLQATPYKASQELEGHASSLRQGAHTFKLMEARKEKLSAKAAARQQKQRRRRQKLELAIEEAK